MTAITTFIKPPRLKRGDTVAVLSPSWGGPSLFPAAYEVGVKNLQDTLGVRVKEYSTTRADADYLDKHPEERAEDLNRAFADTEVKAIFSTIGGEDSIRILPFLDLDLIRSNPKIIMGFSDTSTILTYLNHHAGLVTFNGPSVMAGFASLNNLPSTFAQHIQQMLMRAEPEYTYQPFEAIAAETQDWGTPGYSGETRLVPNTNVSRWLQGTSVAQGQLFGGCLDVLEFLKGTRFWPQPDFWQGKILFLETSEEKPTPDQVRYVLRNYGMQGILGDIEALLFGRPYKYTAQESEELDRQIMKVVAEEFGHTQLPVVTNMDFWHSVPQWIMPLGVTAEVDCTSKTFRLLESPVE